jgi:hypothetical protein
MSKITYLNEDICIGRATRTNIYTNFTWFLSTKPTAITLRAIRRKGLKKQWTTVRVPVSLGKIKNNYQKQQSK